MKSIFTTITQYMHHFFPLICSIVALLTACHSLKQEPPLSNLKDSSCYHNGELSSAERLKKIPFNNANQIVVVSYPGALNSKTPVLHDTICTSETIDFIRLSSDQTDQLTDILYNYNYSLEPVSGQQSQAGCYYPRHSIIFLDKSKKVTAYLEICFECKGIESNIPEEHFGVFCAGKYELLRDFFASIGITFFENKIDTRGGPIPK